MSATRAEIFFFNFLGMKQWGILCFCWLIAVSGAWSQVTDTIAAEADSFSILTPPSLPSTSNDTSILNLDTLSVERMTKLEALSTEVASFRNLVNSGLRTDTVEMRRKLQQFERDLAVMEKTLTQDSGRINAAFLFTVQDIPRRIEAELKGWLEDIDAFNQALLNQSETIEDMFSDPILVQSYYTTDSFNVLYRERFRTIRNNWYASATELRNAFEHLALLRSDIFVQNLKADLLVDRLSELLADRQVNLWVNEAPPLWSARPRSYLFSMGEAFRLSRDTVGTILSYFLASSSETRFFIVLAFFLFYLWIRRNLRKIRHSRTPEERSEVFKPLSFTPAYPLLSALLVCLLIAPFFYRDLPGAYLEIIWLLVSLTLIPLIFKQWPNANVRFIALLFGLVTGQVLLNLIIIPSFPERWLQLSLQIGGFLVSRQLLQKLDNLPFQKIDLIKRVIQISLWFSGLAIFLNVIGSFTLSKIFITTALFGTVFAFAIKIIIEILLEAIYLQQKSGNLGTSVSAWMQFYDLRNRLRRVLEYIGMAFWIMTFLKNLLIYRPVFGAIQNFLLAERSIGNFPFTFMSLLVFLLIIYLTTIAGQLINFIFGREDGKTQPIAGLKASKLGNYLLLVRIGVYAIGFLLALSAAGVQLTEVAIVLGALSVGIGFGLQNIVNNLVSGIILAFEQPLKIGDTIEFGSRIGNIREIGFRSSTIRTFEGSDVIVPNGDLISQQLVNWTRNDTLRRIEHIVSVGYGTNLGQAREIITKILNSNEKILSDPAPIVLVQTLNNSSVDLRVLFWTEDRDGWLVMRSDILETIYNRLRSEGIEIPFPKRDITVRMAADQKAAASAKPEEDPADHQPSP